MAEDYILFFFKGDSEMNFSIRVVVLNGTFVTPKPFTLVEFEITAMVAVLSCEI